VLSLTTVLVDSLVHNLGYAANFPLSPREGNLRKQTHNETQLSLIS
jgi:hypothetical protein